MRILLTNHALSERAGSELYVRDLATALLARDHQPIAYSRRLGAVAAELRAATVLVLDDLEPLDEPPEIIHGQHHLETMTALARFPHTPAIYVCHGWLPAEEAPPVHPRILRYVAVDDLVRQRLVDECGIAPAMIETHRNFVDLDRFQPRPPLPEKPSKALAFSNYIQKERGLPELRRACDERDLALDAVGFGVGASAAAPERILGDYDVVFAKGRAALEAAAVGCAVILCDAAGLGPLVTSGELERIRRLNFGVRLLREPISAAGVAKRLERYDAADATSVSQRLRQEAGLDRAADRLLDLYREVLSEHATAEYDSGAEARAMARYLRHGPLAPDFFQYERTQHQVALSREGDRVRALAEQLEGARQAQSQAAADREALRTEALRLSRALEARDQEMTRLSAIAEAERADGDQARTEAAETRAQLERAARQAGEADADLRRELDWMLGSATWRWRNRLLSQGWLRRLYRALRR